MRELLIWATIVTVGLFVLCMIQGRSLSFGMFLLGVIIALFTQFLLIDETLRVEIAKFFRLTEIPNISTTIAIGAGVAGYVISFFSS